MGGVTFYGLQKDWRGSSIFVRGGEVTMLTKKTSGVLISELIAAWVQYYILYLQHEILHGLLRSLPGS